MTHRLLINLSAHENKPESPAAADETGFGIPVGTDPKWSTIAGVFTGDCLHNFIDGIAVGISWSVSWGQGLGTTFAILMHELPHELGDFVLYRKLGLTTKRAIGANLIAALISYAGLFTGLAVGGDPTVTKWLLAIVAGLFIHISMVDVVSKQYQTLIHFSFEFSDARNETDKRYRPKNASIRAPKCWNATRLHYYGFAFNFRRRFRNQIIILL